MTFWIVKKKFLICKIYY